MKGTPSFGGSEDFGTVEDDQLDEVLESGPGYVIERLPKGVTLSSTGRWTQEATAVMRTGRIPHLSLTYLDGFAERSLDFIESWPGLREVTLIERSLQDIRGLERLDTLEGLFLEADKGAEIDIRAFRALTTLGTQWAHIKQTIMGVELPVRTALLRGVTSPDLTDIAGLRQLRHLEIVGSRSLVSLRGIEGTPISELRVASAPRLQDLNALSELPALEELVLEGCRSIRSLEALSGRAPNLRELWMDDCGRIETLDPVGDLTGLEVVVLSGDTSVADGDLGPLRSLLALRILRTPYRRHYNTDPAEIAPAN